MIAAGPLWRQQEEAEGEGYRDEEQQPILIREVEQDGKIVLAVEGQSTLPQTVFNMTKYVLPNVTGSLFPVPKIYSISSLS